MLTPADSIDTWAEQFHHVERPNENLRDSRHYPRLKKIYERMGEEGFVENGLNKLEELLWKELKWRNKKAIDEDTLKANFKEYYKKENAKDFNPDRREANINKGVLTEVLESIESQYGFGSVSYAWGTSASAFLQNLTARRPFKDYGASREHGDNTHRIQWFIICTGLFDGISDAAKYYEETAYWTGEMSINGQTRKLYAWDLLCDSADNTTGFNKAQAKGRSPMYLMDLCRDEKYSLLSTFTDYRRMKDISAEVRIMQTPHARRERLKNYGVMVKTLDRAARRFHNCAFSSLSERKQNSLAKLLGKQGFT